MGAAGNTSFARWFADAWEAEAVAPGAFLFGRPLGTRSQAQRPTDTPQHTAQGGGEGPHQPQGTYDASLDGAEANAARLKGLGFCDYGGSHTVTGVIEVSKAL